MILLNIKSDLNNVLVQRIHWLSTSLRVRVKVLWPKDSMMWLSTITLTTSPLTLSLTVPPTWSPCSFPFQSLCSCYFLCLKSSSSRHQNGCPFTDFRSLFKGCLNKEDFVDHPYKKRETTIFPSPQTILFSLFRFVFSIALITIWHICLFSFALL